MSTSVSPGRASVAAEPSLGLRKRSLPFREVFAQSLAGTGPSGSLAFGPALVFASAGHGTWISYVLSLVSLLLVGWAFAVFGTRLASAGSMYTMVAEGLGPIIGVLIAWACVVAYTVIAMVVVASLGLMVVVTWHLLRAALVDWITLLLGAISALFLSYYKMNSAWLILGGATAGLAFTLLGGRP